MTCPGSRSDKARAKDSVGFGEQELRADVDGDLAAGCANDLKSGLTDRLRCRRVSDRFRFGQVALVRRGGPRLGSDCSRRRLDFLGHGSARLVRPPFPALSGRLRRLGSVIGWRSSASFSRVLYH